MKLKGINPIEQHVEKIVLAVVGIVFVGVLAVQFLVAPNDVDYEGQKVPPNQVMIRLGDRAAGLLSRMNDPEPKLPAVETPDLSGAYAERLASSAFDAPRVAGSSLGDRFALSITEVESLDGPVTPLRLPAPDAAMAASQWTTVDPFFAASHPGVRPYLPTAQPMDKVSVTVEASVPGELIAESLRQADEGRRAIPSHWWSEGGRGMLEVLTVQAERQQQNADGSWGAAEPIESVRWLPGLMEAYNEGSPEDETSSWDSLRASELRGLVSLAQADPSLVSQPGYLPSIAGVEWVPPSKVADRQARLDVEAKIGRFERDIENLETEIAQIEEQRTATQNAGQRSTQARQPQQRGGLVVGGGGGGQNPAANRPSRADRLQQRIDAKREEIAERQTELDALYEQLDEFADAGIGQSAQPRRSSPTRPAAGGPAGPGGYRVLGGGPRVLGGDPSTSRSGRTPRTRAAVQRTPGVESPGPLLEQESYPVWVHDFDAEPGAVYRYRVRYGVNNPLFKRERSLGSEEASLMALAEEPVVESDWSSWTDPVQVGRTSYFFVTNAQDQGQLGQSASSATAEVFRMFYGYYRKHTISLEPGDAVQGEFRLPDNLPLFDVSEADAEAVAAYFAEREEGPQPTAARAATGGTSDDAEDDSEDRDWLTLVEPRYPLSVDAVMLDVAEYPIVDEAALSGGRTPRVLEVVFFDPISGVVARRPDRDQEAPEYLAVQQSAGLSESAKVLMPDVEAVP